MKFMIIQMAQNNKLQYFMSHTKVVFLNCKLNRPTSYAISYRILTYNWVFIWESRPPSKPTFLKFVCRRSVVYIHSNWLLDMNFLSFFSVNRYAELFKGDRCKSRLNAPIFKCLYKFSTTWLRAAIYVLSARLWRSWLATLSYIVVIWTTLMSHWLRSHAGPSTWNWFPAKINDSCVSRLSLLVCERHLKTFLFSSY